MSHASGSNGENSYSPDRERNREAMNDDNAKIAKDALFNRKYVEIIFRKCNCVPLTNRESVDVMDMQTWFSLVIDNVKEALDSRDTLLASLRRERDEARNALNPAKLSVFDMIRAEEITKEQVWPFILAAGHGCISGSVSEWPQLKPAIRWSQHEIERLESRLVEAQAEVENLGRKLGKYQLDSFQKEEQWKKRITSLESALASARERERKIVEQFQIEVLSKNDFYYPKAICKNPPVIPRSGVNGCLSCQVSATCLLVNEMSESIESSTPPRSKVTGNPKTYEFVHKVIRPILQKHFIYGDDFNDAEVLRDIFESVTKFDAWSGGK